MGENLNPRREAFCIAYIAERFNGVAAAREAGFEGDGDTLATTASRLLRIAKVKKRVAELKHEYFEDKKRLGRDVISELYNLGMRRMSDIVTKNTHGSVEIKDFEEMGGSEAAINKLETRETIMTDEDGNKTGVVAKETKVWLEGKTKPLELLAKYSNVIVDKQEIDHTVRGVEEVKVTIVDPKKGKEGKNGR